MPRKADAKQIWVSTETYDIYQQWMAERDFKWGMTKFLEQELRDHREGKCKAATSGLFTKETLQAAVEAALRATQATMRDRPDLPIFGDKGTDKKNEGRR